MKSFKYLIVFVIALLIGAGATFQWQGSKYGMSLYDFLKRPEVVERIVEVEVVKVVVVSDNSKVQMINQEYRDALLKISAVEYDSSRSRPNHDIMRKYALNALAFIKTAEQTPPEITYESTSK
jgi:hypothetical protein